MLRKLLLAGSTAILASVISVSAMAAGPLKIGALLPMTGALQDYGATSLNGIKLAIEQINAAGGVNGQPVQLAVGDTQTTAQSGVDAAQKLVSVEGAQAIVGAMSSGVTIPVAKSVTSVLGVAQISNASTSPVITNLDDKDFLFRTVPSDAFQGVALAQVTKEKGIKSVSTIYVNNDYGKGLADAFAKAFTAVGGKVVHQTAYEPKQASYRGELQSLSKGGPQALVLIGYPEDGTPILKQSLENGFFTKFIFTDGMKAPEIISAIGAKYLDGSFGTSPEALATSKASQDFTKAYDAKYGSRPPKPYIDTAYDAVYIIALAAEKAHSTNPKAIRDALRFVANPPGTKVLPGEFKKAKALLDKGKDINYVGAAGSEDFDKHGDVSGTFAHWEIKNGKIVTVKIFEPK